MDDERGHATGIPRLRAVLFDLDGTLIDSGQVWNDAVRSLAVDRGELVTDDLLALTHGLDSHSALRLVHHHLSWPASEVEANVARVAAVVAGSMRHGVEWRPGAVELVSTLRDAGMPIALVTSSYREIVEVALGNSVEMAFDVIVCGDEVAAVKPDPEPYRTAAKLLDVDIAACVAVEDSPMGAESAHGAGCTVLYITGADAPACAHEARASLVGVDLAVLSGLLGRCRGGMIGPDTTAARKLSGGSRPSSGRP